MNFEELMEASADRRNRQQAKLIDGITRHILGDDEDADDDATEDDEAQDNKKDEGGGIDIIDRAAEIIYGGNN